MPAPFKFTTRDWLWFCVVFAVAIGWGTHFRYSRWYDAKAVILPSSFSRDELSQPLAKTQEALIAERETVKELKFVILELLGRGNQDSIKKARAKYRAMPEPQRADVLLDF